MEEVFALDYYYFEKQDGNMHMEIQLESRLDISVEVPEVSQFGNFIESIRMCIDIMVSQKRISKIIRNDMKICCVN